MATKTLSDSSEKILNRFPPLNKLDKSFDKESFEYLSSLPKLNKIVSTLLNLTFFIAVAIAGVAFLMYFGFVFGGIEINPLTFINFLIILIIFGIGFIPAYIIKRFIHNKAPLGHIADEIIGIVRKGNVSKGKVGNIQKLCRKIIERTDSTDSNQIPIILLRALSFQVSALTALDHKQTIVMAKEAILSYKQLLEVGVKTPLVNFGIATSAHISGQYDLAIESYVQYLLMRPKDTYTREILEKCVQESIIIENENVKHLEQGNLEISDISKTCDLEDQAICDTPSIGIPTATVDDKTLEKYTQIYRCNLKGIDLAIIESWHRIVSKQPEVYTYPNIPENKLSNAKKFYAKLTHSDIVLGLWDITVFGSAKEGMLFTTRSVYWKDTSGEQANKISFAELDTSKIQHKSKWPHINIVLGDNKVVMTGSYRSCKELMSFIIEAALLLQGSKKLDVADDMNMTADKSEQLNDSSNKTKKRVSNL